MVLNNVIIVCFDIDWNNEIKNEIINDLRFENEDIWWCLIIKIKINMVYLSLIYY